MGPRGCRGLKRPAMKIGGVLIGLGGKKTFFGGIPHFRKRPIGVFYVGKAKMETYHPQIDHLDISKVSGMKHQSIWVVCGIALPTLAHLQLGYKPCISHGNITCN